MSFEYVALVGGAFLSGLGVETIPPAYKIYSSFRVILVLSSFRKSNGACQLTIPIQTVSAGADAYMGARSKEYGGAPAHQPEKSCGFAGSRQPQAIAITFRKAKAPDARTSAGVRVQRSGDKNRELQNRHLTSADNSLPYGCG